ncbi:MAG TPA: tetratricopeptide repeat protein [Longimicrobiales bacterium]|nr:tetratricopeptide repeat protein [Longimicrobiales bacterium]
MRRRLLRLTVRLALALAALPAAPSRLEAQARPADAALAPLASDVGLARARGLARAGRTDAAIAAFEAWLLDHPGDAAAWRELARQQRSAGRLRSALASLEKAEAIQPDPHAARDAGALRSRIAPALEPDSRASRDSDGNGVLRVGLSATALVGDALRLGAGAARTRVGAWGLSASADEAVLSAGWRPRAALALDGSVGGVRTAASDGATVTPVATLRARWRSPGSGPAAELRATRAPVTATPELLATPVLLDEARGSFDFALAGPVRLRSMGRIGALTGAGDTNRRAGAGGALVLRAGPTLELSGAYQRFGYDHDPGTGYFAPRRIESMEIGAYGEYYGAWPLAIAADVGGGAARITSQAGATGAWRRALRLWSQLSWDLGRARELRLELDGYDTLAGEIVGASTGGWRYGSAALGVRWPLR